MVLEPLGEMGEVAESELEGDYLHPGFRLNEATAGVFDPQPIPVLAGCRLKIKAKQANQMVLAQSYLGREPLRIEWFG